MGCNGQVVFLLGAGSNLDFAPETSSSHITEIIKGFIPEEYPEESGRTGEIYRAISLIEKAFEHLDSIFGYGNYSFEELIQLLVDLHGVKSRISEPLLPYAIPETLDKYDPTIYQTALKFALEKVFNNIGNCYDNDPPKWYSEFFSQVQQFIRPLDLSFFTLNYDDYLDRCLKNVNDGFVKKGNDYDCFDIDRSLGTDGETTLLNHLHGSVYFNYKPSEEDACNYYFYKYDKPITSYGDHLKIWTQDGRYAIIPPIITGLDKTNSNMIEPFSIYHTNFVRKTMGSDLVVIIGYGFRDIYINIILDTYIRKGDSKILLVSPSTDHPLFKELPEVEGVIHSNEESTIVWYKCTFKEACEKDLINTILKLIQ